MAQNLNKKGQTHDQLQASCFKWACNAYHPHIYRHLISIPNDAARGNVVVARHLQAIGVTAGVWDMALFWVIHYDESFYIPHTYWWEFKVGADKLSDKQKKFRDSMEILGHTFNVCSEEEEFKEQFKLIVEPTLDYIKRIYGANESNIKVI